MNISRKQKLVEYLYPTDEMMSFMCNDLYQELLKVVSPTNCISSKNMANKVRLENLRFVKQQIIDFVQSNKCYHEQICYYYKAKDSNKALYDILIGLVFFIANTTNKYSRLDIFYDKKSICYDGI